jgi:hypothetical protein
VRDQGELTWGGSNFKHCSIAFNDIFAAWNFYSGSNHLVGSSEKRKDGEEGGTHFEEILCINKLQKRFESDVASNI